ncbi:CPBP family intramembrane glutamic endopeptidase [Caulobacter sp. LARHSG274]
MDAARRPTSLVLGLLLAAVAVAAAMFGAPRVLGLLPAMSNPLGERLVQFAAIMSPLILCAVLAGAWEGRPASVERMPRLAATNLGFWTGLVAFGLAAVTAGLAGGLSANHPGATPLGPLGLVAACLLTLFQVFGEELFFRGWLQPLLAARCGPWIGLALASVLFAVAHAVVVVPGPLAFLNVFLAGVLFGVLALRTGGLWAPVAAHWAWNAAEMSGLGLTPNPGLDPLGSVWDLDLGGPPWLGGGPDELNGSITATAVLVAAIVLCAALRSTTSRGKAAAGLPRS